MDKAVALDDLEYYAQRSSGSDTKVRIIIAGADTFV